MAKEEKTIVTKTTTVKTNSGKKASATKKTSTKKPATKKKSTAKKKTTTRKKSLPRVSQTMSKKEAFEFEERIIDNFVSMQKVMTHLAENFDELSKQLSKLLNLFDQSAKALTEKEVNLELKGGQKEDEIMEKLNSVLDQNKLIAKGLTLMHEHNTNMSNRLFSDESKSSMTPSATMTPNTPSMYPKSKLNEESMNKIKEEQKESTEPKAMSIPKPAQLSGKISKPTEPETNVFNSKEFS